MKNSRVRALIATLRGIDPPRPTMPTTVRQIKRAYRELRRRNQAKAQRNQKPLTARQKARWSFTGS